VISVLVHSVPEPPGGGSWDSAFEFKGIAPDLYVCVESPAYGVESCTAYCPDTYQCEQRFPNLEFGVPLNPRARSLNVQVLEFSPRGNRLVGQFMGIDPFECEPATPCTEVKAEGTLAVSFTPHLVSVEVAPTTRPPAPTSPSTPPPTSWLDTATDWFNDQVGSAVEDAGGIYTKFIEGLAQQGAAAETAYGACLVRKIEGYELKSRYDNICAARTGDARDSCAAQILGEEHPDDVARCNQNELQVGFLANLWKAGCNVLGFTCN
jgi:hypothetical protein